MSHISHGGVGCGVSASACPHLAFFSLISAKYFSSFDLNCYLAVVPINLSRAIAIRREENDKALFCYIDRVAFGKPLGNLKMGASCQRLSFHLHLQGGLGVESITGDLIKQVWVRKLP